MSFEQRYERVLALARALEKHHDEVVDCAIRDLQFTVKDSTREVDTTVNRLRMYADAVFLRDRLPLHPRARVNLLLSYNGSAWLNTAITSIYVVGNRLTVKFSSKGRRIMALTKDLYWPIFGDAVAFYSCFHCCPN